MEKKEIFEVGDIVLLGASERELHANVTPIGTVVESENGRLHIRWDSGHRSASFDPDGIVSPSLSSTQMRNLVDNYGKLTEQELFALKLKFSV